MAANMNLINKKCFPLTTRVTDRFHVHEVVQGIRIKHRWKTLDEENKAYKQTRKKGVEYGAEVFTNGDTRR